MLASLPFLFVSWGFWVLPEPTPSVDEALTATIKAHHQKYLQTLIKGDSQAYIDMFTDEGIVLFPGEYVVGKEKLKDRQERLLKQVQILDGDIHTLSLEASGNLAYEIGRFQYTILSKANGNRVQLSGRFLVIWKKQADGSWRMAVDSGFPDPQPRL